MGIISIINKYSKLSLKLAIGTAIFDENKSIMTKVKTIQNVNFIDRYFAKDCLLTLAKSRLALGSPGCSFVCLFVTMLKMAQYTGKWLLTAP